MQQLRRARWMDSSDQILIAPYYSIEGSQNSRLVFVNRFADPIDYELRVLSPSGQTLPLGGDVIKPRGVLEVDLKEALSIAPPIFRRGTLELRYFGDPAMTQAWMILSGSRGVTAKPLLKLANSTESEAIAAWDLSAHPDAASIEPLIAVHNSGPTPIRFTISWRPAEADEKIVRRMIPPFHTLFLRAPRQIGKMDSGALWAHHDGTPSQVSVAGFLVTSEQVLGTLSLQAPSTIASPSTFEGFPLPNTPNAKVFVSLFNPGWTDGPEDIDVVLADLTTGDARVTRHVVLPPRALKTVDVRQLVADEAAGDLGRVRVRIASKRGPMLASGYAITTDGAYIDLPLISREKSHGTGTYPIPALKSYDVQTTFINLGEERALLYGYFSSDQGEYALEPIELPPGATHRLDFQELADNCQPDRLGRRIDPDFESGFFQWTSREGSIELLARTEIRPRDGTDTVGFNCFGCCEEFPSGDVIPGDVGLDVGETTGLETVEYVDTCAGRTGPYHAYPDSLYYSAPFSWNGWQLSASGLSNQTVSFDASGEYWWVTCIQRLRHFFGFGDATSDRCMHDYGPDGYDESPDANGCHGQTSNCGTCYTCCEKIKDVGECRCAFGGETCRALAAQGCFDCKELCFGKFTDGCANMLFDCT